MDTIDKVALLLRERAETLATAESCTGGRIASALTSRAGASDYFRGGVVAYSNDVKTDVLGVDAEIIAAHGAVSEQTACQMALGARRITGATRAIATTGIAGPGGGSVEKPVGTVWIATASPRSVVARLMHFDGSREHIMQQAVRTAIEMLLEEVSLEEVSLEEVSLEEVSLEKT